jgi:hypothetical protein
LNLTAECLFYSLLADNDSTASIRRTLVVLGRLSSGHKPGRATRPVAIIYWLFFPVVSLSGFFAAFSSLFPYS